MAPDGIKALGDDVVRHFRGVEMVEVPLGDVPVPALVYVDGDAHRGAAGGRFHAANPGLQEARQVGPLFGFVIRLRRIVLGGTGDFELGHGPGCAAGDLIADLDHIGHGPGVLQRLDAVVGVFFPLLFQVVDAHAAPCDGNLLVLGVGPGVGEMQVQKELCAQVFDLLGQRNGGLQGIVGGASDGRDEDANAEYVPAVIHQDGGLVAGLAVFLIGGQTATTR